MSLKDSLCISHVTFFFQAEDGIRDFHVTGVPDVCSSDLSKQWKLPLLMTNESVSHSANHLRLFPIDRLLIFLLLQIPFRRSEERRVGKECRYARCRFLNKYRKKKKLNDRRIMLEEEVIQ